jgi:hypothetical protein
VGGEVVSVQSLRLKVRVWRVDRVVEEDCVSRGTPSESSSAKHPALDRDNTLLKPGFLPLVGRLRCHRALENISPKSTVSTQQPGKSQGNVRFDYRLG